MVIKLTSGGVMRVKGFYRLRELSNSSEQQQQVTTNLCFICAVKEILKRTLYSESISFMTTEYESMRCENCGRLITDEVSYND